VAPVIEYQREFDFAVTPAELWATIEDAEEFESWWPWLREFSIDGGSLKTGTVMHGVVVPPLPYRMRVDVELVRCRRPNLIDALVHGDLKGEAKLRLRRADGGTGTRANVSWRIEMMQRPMRIASRLAHPLLVKAHDVVVDVTVAGFRRHLVPGSETAAPRRSSRR
jgi:carbon monoxide dehydrogenase subunit G